MSDERKPSEDLKEGFGLLFRAARKAAKRIDVGKIDRELDKAITQVSRVVSGVGKVVGDEINRMANNPPWDRSETSKAATPPQEQEPPVRVEEPSVESSSPKKPDGSGHSTD